MPVIQRSDQKEGRRLGAGAPDVEHTGLQRAARSKKGVFTLSLDCEGLWGMADRESVFVSGAINNHSLDDAYRFIADELDKNEVICTAAFVSCFAAEYDAVRAQLDKIDILAEMNPDWFQNVRPRLRDGRPQALSGLEGNRYWKRLASSGHEMAWHGATHLPLHPSTSCAAVSQELELASSLAAGLGGIGTTVIFPRNLIGHLETLRDAGFEAYRDHKGKGNLRRLAGYLREWAIRDHSDHDLPRSQDGWHVSPSGHFLNWPSGLRSTIPVEVTVRRWRSMLRHAAETGGYVHMWFHPHNLITAPRMRESFRQIIREVGILSAKGDIANLSISSAREMFA